MTARTTERLHLYLVEAAMAAPDRTALRLHGETLSYGDLASRAAALAGTLNGLGIGRGDRVGLWLDKSFRTSIAIFGILQSGAAYVPIDAGSPPERVRRVLSQADCRVLVTEPAPRRDIAAALEGTGVAALVGAEIPGRTCVSWDAALTGPEAPALAPGASEEDLSYIMFTSGSTGTPKGMMHTHRSATAYARMSHELYGLTAEDRVSNASPPHFDMSTFDHFTAARAGASTTIIPEPVLKMPASLAELIETDRLTVWYSVPFALIQMLRFGVLDGRDLSSVRWVLFGGEPFVAKHLEGARRHFSAARFGNVYGPAEVNQCTYHHMSPDWTEADGQPPIGVGCDGVRLKVVDDDDREVAPGEPGELLVHAPTMMEGYWQDPDRNRAAFHVADDAAETRYYRTGDLVRARPDGELLYLGRNDRQIKSRGYRVELDHVEAALARHPDIVEAAAFPVRLDESLRVIGAAVMPAPGRALEAADLTAFAAGQLEPYARPARIEIMAELPRTTSGKIDRKRLSDLFGSGAESGGDRGVTHA